MEIIDPATLTKGQKQKLWAGIKRDNPALAEMLKTDTNIAQLKSIFNAKVVFEINDVIQYMTEKE